MCFKQKKLECCLRERQRFKIMKLPSQKQRHLLQSIFLWTSESDDFVPSETKNQKGAGCFWGWHGVCDNIKAGPPEAILVIFSRRSLFFFVCLKAFGKYKKWHHFCAHVQWWSPRRHKTVEKKAPRFVEFNFLTNRNRQKQFSQSEIRRADLQNVASKI